MNETTDEEQPVHLAAGALGWILPGLGHFRIGEARRGRLVMLGVLGLFLTGVLVGGVDCVDRREDGLWFLAQGGVGPIAFLTDALNVWLLKSGRVGTMLPMTLPNGAMTQVNSFRGVGVVNDMGTLFTSMAGLMNVAALLDAMRGPRKAVG
jgi:hypothetical protein